MTNVNDPDFLHRSEQGSKRYCDHVVYGYASMFRAFCAQEGLTRAEALELTSVIIRTRESVAAAALLQRRAEPPKGAE